MPPTITDRIRSLTDNDLFTTELQTTLNTIFAQCPLSDSDSLLLSSILLNRIVPQTYLLMVNSMKKVVYSLFSSKVGMNQLIQAIKIQSNIDNTYLYIDIFIHVVQDHLRDLATAFQSREASDLASWKSLLSIKIPECLGLITVWLIDNNNYPDNLYLDRSNIREMMEIYTGKLSILMLENAPEDETQLQCTRQILNSLLLKEPIKVMDIILNHWNSCVELYSHFDSRNKKQNFLFVESQMNFIKGLINSMCMMINRTEMITPWFQFISLLFTKIKLNDMKTTILSQCEKSTNVMAVYVWLKILGSPKMNYVLSQLNKLGNKEYIMNTSLNSQQFLTEFVVLLLKNMSDGDIERLSTEVTFLNTISARLECKSQTARELGMIIADYVYMRVNGKIMFSILSYNSKRDQFMDVFAQLDNAIPTEKENNASVIINEIQQQSTTKTKLIRKEELPPMTPIMIDMDYNSDDEDSDLDDPSVDRKPTIAKPVFLKDLLHYLTTDSQKDTTTYDKKGIAFSIGIEMARIKKNTPEMKYYCKKLLDAALNLDNTGFPLREDKKFDEDEAKVAFDSWRLSFMIAICTSEPDIVFKYLFQSFVREDWNIATRIQVLTCIGLSCRELCGKDDDFIWGKTNLTKAATKTLSGPGHELFLNLDSEGKEFKKIVDIDQEKKEERLVKALESVGISDGTIIHRSRKLDIDKANKKSELSKNKTTQTTFINKQLPKLYFSMTSIWQEVNAHTFGNGFLVGMMSEYLNSHFHDILTMVYSCGVPSCIQLIDMTIEQLSLLLGQLRTIQISSEFPVMLFKSIVNSLRSVLVDNDRTVSVLRSTAALEISTLFEAYTQVLAEAPLLEEPSRSTSLVVLELLQKYSMINV